MKTALTMLLAMALLEGCATGPLPGPPPTSQAQTALSTTSVHPVSIGVLDEGWHTGLILPLSALGPSPIGLRTWFPRAQYLVFGWGDRSFYMNPHPGLSSEISALFPSPSVLYIRGLRGNPHVAFPLPSRLRWVCISAEQAHRLAAFLNAYLRKRPDGRFIELGRGPMPNSHFFASTGTYSAFHTCNTWTISALAYAGLPVHAQGIVFAGQAMSEVRTVPRRAGCARH